MRNGTPHPCRASRALLLAAAVAVAPATPASAQSTTSQSANATRPAAPPGAADVDAIFARFDRPDSPGCAVGVIQDGRTVLAKGYGSANLDLEVPITPRTVFYVASVSKQFTAAAVILLAQEGKLSLDDEARKHIPELRDYGHPLTIRHLINHTSGLRDYLTLMTLAGMRHEDVHSDDAVLQLILRQRELNFTPGTEYLYSNSGYFLMSELVRRKTGKSLREYADERIFRPLGMTQTHFHDDRTMIVKHRAQAYSPSGDGFRLNIWANFDKVGSGGLMSSVEDLAKWDRNFYTREVGGDFLHAELHRRAILADGDTISYAGGLNVGEYRGLRTVRHGGSSAGYRTEILRFPEQRFSAIALCNVSTATPAAYLNRLAEQWLAGAMKPRVARGSETATAGGNEPAARSPERAAATPRPGAGELAAYVGDFESDEVAATWSVVARGDTLILRHPTLGDRTLRPVARDRFSSGGMTVEFARQGDRVTTMTIRQSRVRAVTFQRR